MMMEKLIHCPACNSENLDNSVYCCQCGSPMRRGIPVRIRKGQWLVIVVMTLILTSIMAAGIQFFSSRHANLSVENQGQAVQGPASVQPKTPKPVPQPDRKDASAMTDRFLPEEQKGEPVGQLTVGSVSIFNPDGFAVEEFPAVVVNGSWLALPTRACIGGDKWFFRAGNEKAIPIEGGLWGRGDAVGFWRLAGEKKFPGPGFATWDQEKPVRLLSMVTGLLSEPMTLTPSGMQGAFIYSSPPVPLESGVFIQNGKVVGWSFGDILEGAYMWPLGSDPNLLYTNYVDDFYNETFAGGREEYFTTALTTGRGASPQRQLQMFAEGFRHQPKLSAEDTPRYLGAENLYPFIANLVDYLMGQGAYHYIAPLVEEPLVWEIGDPALLKNVVLAVQNIYGDGAAVNFMENHAADIQRTMEGKTKELEELHLQFYLEWINSHLDNGDTFRGWQMYNKARTYFDESPELSLAGVQLALADRDWAEAERLLYQREYPAKLREKEMLLADRISDLKGQENKIVIRFAAGSREVPVKASVNGRVEHDFLVDTGASFVTIPSETVKTLGLEDTMSQHQQEVQTAGGPVYANAVMLSSIELQGWVVSDVKALVIDLPGRPGLGLLGLNFLNRFRLDLQTEKGVLVLEPK